MNLLQPVLWGKGIPLQPQHLQAQDGFLESLIRFRTQALSFRPYGFTTLEIDERKLNDDRKLEIRRATGLMPDGSPFDIPNSDGPPGEQLSVPLDARWFREKNELDVCIAISHYHPGQLALSLDEKNTGLRYIPFLQENLADETRTGNARSIQLARRNFRLLFETQIEELRACSWMRVARIRRTGETSFRLSETDPPPLLAVATSSWLDGVCRGLINMLAEKAAELGRQRPKGGAPVFTVLDTAEFWLLHTLNSTVPVLRDLCDTGSRERSSGGEDGSKSGLWSAGVHPVHVYLELSSLAGALLTFRLSKDVTPSYDHDNPGRCFRELTDLIRRLVKEAIPRNYDRKVLDPRSEPNQYSVRVPDEWFKGATEWYLAVDSSLNDNEWSDVLPFLEKSVKISSVRDMSGLVRATHPGVVFSYDSEPPHVLPMKTARHFKLATGGQYWESVEQTRTIAVYLPKVAKAVSVQIVVLKPEDS